ncbi:hypothetical protein DFP72DRAFT_1091632 [Ephemerocybe angulata]|uniref:Uncharacterized protein n=1 Tax=Ephemerocybe angulata TaxID=980116 RepID=A0A8H6HGC4_9AGAR|nr:hypothetical protein DFP72DRAFT_1091632 [Tulosesus angulatus]
MPAFSRPHISSHVTCVKYHPQKQQFTIKVGKEAPVYVTVEEMDAILKAHQEIIRDPHRYAQPSSDALLPPSYIGATTMFNKDTNCRAKFCTRNSVGKMEVPKIPVDSTVLDLSALLTPVPGTHEYGQTQYQPPNDYYQSQPQNEYYPSPGYNGYYSPAPSFQHYQTSEDQADIALLRRAAARSLDLSVTERERNLRRQGESDYHARSRINRNGPYDRAPQRPPLKRGSKSRGSGSGKGKGKEKVPKAPAPTSGPSTPPATDTQQAPITTDPPVPAIPGPALDPAGQPALPTILDFPDGQPPGPFPRGEAITINSASGEALEVNGMNFGAQLETIFRELLDTAEQDKDKQPLHPVTKVPLTADELKALKVTKQPPVASTSRTTRATAAKAGRVIRGPSPDNDGPLIPMSDDDANLTDHEGDVDYDMDESL